MGDIPIVERIMERFNSYGSEIFYMTVNYTPLYNFLKNKITHKALSNV